MPSYGPACVIIIYHSVYPIATVNYSICTSSTSFDPPIYCKLIYSSNMHTINIQIEPEIELVIFAIPLLQNLTRFTKSMGT